MGFFSLFKNIFTSAKIETLNLNAQSFDVKKAFDIQQVGVRGRAMPVSTNRDNLLGWYRKNELAFACINKISESAIDPTPIIEKQNLSGEFETVNNHPLARLLVYPNNEDDAATFWGAWLASEHIFGEAYAEIERNGLGQPVRLHLLNPQNITPISGKGKNGSPIIAYKYNYWGREVEIPAEDILVRRNKDLSNQFYGISPLGVALGAIDLDTAQTDFARAFFNNGGVPSGLLRFPNSTLTPEKAEEARQRFNAKYTRNGNGYNGTAVLDQNAEYQKIGANLDELNSDSMRCQSEARICSVFGVPPILVGAYVGLLHVNQRASVKEAQTDFWFNKMSPLFKRLRIFLTFALLPEFERIELIENGSIRVNWDMSQVMALQEDTDKRHERARKNLDSGGITLNEFRAEIGKDADANGDYYLRPKRSMATNPETALIEIEKVAKGSIVESEQVN